MTCPECGFTPPTHDHAEGCTTGRLDRNPEVKERLKAATARMDDAVELRPAEPVYPEMDALRRALDYMGIDGPVPVVSAAREVLATFDRQLAAMAVMRAQHVDTELLRRALDQR